MIDINLETSRKLYTTDLVHACNWAVKKLIPRAKNIRIDIEVKPMNEEYFGTAERYGPRHFKINLNSRCGKKDMLSTLMHEMVHVKQYFRGELKIKSFKTGGGYWTWKGCPNFQKYDNQPWEKEAFAAEEGLFKEYRKYERECKS